MPLTRGFLPLAGATDGSRHQVSFPEICVNYYALALTVKLGYGGLGLMLICVIGYAAMEIGHD
ncbi:hypothetical protein CP49_08190 [Bradyrhizobium valentinum]|uniref:Uncharacterized protein n=1 Tax=Bradyrhizobium valentinum TaxID=1518501 RepID=A0A0R3M320_9BRAD|nr:hypothetical protein CP49_08190 [Bradyrhizobium valentinum]